jgi:CRP-like cAMP-binding protein
MLEGTIAMPALTPYSHHSATDRFRAALPATLNVGSARSGVTVERIGAPVSLRRDQVLFYEGDPAQHCFKVVSGVVRSCKLLADGRRYVGQFHLSGDFVAIESDDTYRSTVEAVNDATLLRFPRRALDQLMQQQPQLGKSLLGILCGDLFAAQAQMLLLGRKSAIERLASFLLEMLERTGEDDRLELPMTRADIADHLGLTVETVSRLFTQLKGRGIIRSDAVSEVVIRRRRELEEIAEGT